MIGRKSPSPTKPITYPALTSISFTTSAPITIYLYLLYYICSYFYFIYFYYYLKLASIVLYTSISFVLYPLWTSYFRKKTHECPPRHVEDAATILLSRRLTLLARGFPALARCARRSPRPLAHNSLVYSHVHVHVRTERCCLVLH